MARKSTVGFGPRNILRAAVLSAAVYAITGSLMQCLAFLGFYVVYVLLAQMVGFEPKD